MKSILKINFNRNRIYGLDILRCLAILFVVFGHGRYLFSIQIINRLEYFVFDGVSIFFVLSGFLIGGVLIKEIETKEFTTKSLYLFWKRRWFRTIPNYLFLLTVVIVLNFLFVGGFDFKNVISYFFFVQNLYYPHPNLFSEAWSLSVEEWFYLVIPIMLFVSVKLLNFKSRNTILVVASLIIVSVTLFRYYKYLGFEELTKLDWDYHFRKQVFTRLDSLMFGVVGAYISKYHNNIWRNYKLISFGIGVVLLMSNQFFPKENLSLMYKCVFSFTLNSIGTLLMLPYLSSVKSGKGIIYEGITYISLISYSMYLINYTLVKDWILPYINVNFNNDYINATLNYILFWFLTIILSILLYKYFEVPTTNLRENKSL